MNRNRNLIKKVFDLQLFAGGAAAGTSITRDDVSTLIPIQESNEIIQGVVEIGRAHV